MVFILPNRLAYLADEKKDLIRRLARRYVARRAMTPFLEKLDDYLEKETGKGLKENCMELINGKTEIARNAATDEFVVSFIDKESKDLAKLITYGNSEIKGCDILQKAFSQDY